VLDSDELREIIEEMMKSTVERQVQSHTNDEVDENWDLDALVSYLKANLLEEGDITVNELKGKDPEEMIELILEITKAKYDQKEEELTEDQMREFEKVILLRTVDTKWMDHIDQMDQLRQGIHLRAYGQTDPLREYQMEGFAMFEQMIATIEEEVSKYIMKAQIRDNLQREEVAKGATAVSGDQDEKKEKKRRPIRNNNAVGRNEPCPCGSGKKYKQCCGK